MAGPKLQNTTTEEILAVLSEWSIGQFSSTLAKSSDPALGPVVDKLNEVAQSLKQSGDGTKTVIAPPLISLVMALSFCLATGRYFRSMPLSAECTVTL